MTKSELIRAFGDISDNYLSEADLYISQRNSSSYKSNCKQRITNRRITKTSMTKFIALAACFCLIVGGVFIAINSEYLFENPNATPDADGHDRVYGAYFNGYYYEMITHHYHEVYPELNDIFEQTETGYIYNIKEEHLGEYIGVFPAILDVYPEGKAYHYSAYPDYDSIIIVKRENEYTFYVASSGNLHSSIPTDSSTTLYHYGAPTELRVIYGTDEKENILHGEELIAVFDILSGKKRVSPAVIEEKVYNKWCETYGSAGVHFNGKDLSYDSAEAREKFAFFMAETNTHLWVSTDKGFNDVLIYYNAKFGYFNYQNYNYMLTEDEVIAIEELLGIR